MLLTVIGNSVLILLMAAGNAARIALFLGDISKEASGDAHGRATATREADVPARLRIGAKLF